MPHTLTCELMIMGSRIHLFDNEYNLHPLTCGLRGSFMHRTNYISSFFLATKIPIFIILIQTNIVIFHPSLSCLQLLFCSLYTFSLSVHASSVKRIVCLFFFEFYLLFYWFFFWTDFHIKSKRNEKITSPRLKFVTQPITKEKLISITIR